MPGFYSSGHPAPGVFVDCTFMRPEGLLLLWSVCVLLSWGGAHLVRQHARRWGLLAMPEQRSSHVQVTPHGGGLGMVVTGSAVALVMAFWQPGMWLAGVTLLALLLALLGLADDRHPQSVRLRLGVQILLVSGLLGLWSGTVHPLPLGIWLAVLVGGVWWINLFNFMDGLDGFAASEALYMSLMVALISVWGHPERLQDPLWLMLGVLAALSAGFLLVNWPPARIFMGDVGSTWLAFWLLALALWSVSRGWVSALTWVLLAGWFVTDATWTLMTRLLTRQRWYSAHRSHAYQRLARHWKSHRRVTLALWGVNVLWLAPWAWASSRHVLAGGDGVYGLALLPLLGLAHALGAGQMEPTPAVDRKE